MDQRTNYLSLILLDALEDENESDIYFILERNIKAIDPSYVPHDRGIAPMHYVCGMEKQHLAIDVIKRFLIMGANPNCRSEDNMTPLHVAAMYGRVEIVRLLLENGAQLEVYDDDRKTPVLYAIEECQFEVVQVMRDHIFLNKYEKRKQRNSKVLSESKFESSLQSRVLNNKQTSTPQQGDEQQMIQNKNLLKVTNNLDECLSNDGDNNKLTPNRINYNYDVTSPYYINITHRRHKPQPKFPELKQQEHKSKNNDVDALSISMQNTHLSFPEAPTDRLESVNIFTLTQENIKELTQRDASYEKSRVSLIETWREKVQKSRARQSIIKQFDDIVEMIDHVVENDHLNFTNTELKEKSSLKQQQPDIEVDSGAACGSTSSSVMDATEYKELPNKIISYNVVAPQVLTRKSPLKPQMSLSKLMQTVAEAEIQDFESEHLKNPSPQQSDELESSYQTVPEIIIASTKNDELLEQNTSTNFIRSPLNNEYFLQMTEAYVHTDDENGLVFYETKLLTNVGNKQAKLRNQRTPNTPASDLNSTLTSQSTNLTLPLDYETDTLRAELTTFGEPPGPITKSTKKLYIKRLIKYKRKTALMQELREKHKQNETKFSVELQRTLKSTENFQRIPDYMKYETQSMEYFASGQNNKQLMREGHLKQSFIYMLIDPRISCNLPGESVFLEKFDVWQRFLQAIFYVGKGKTSRPYSHLYEAMKTHSRLHNAELQEKTNKHGKKISIKKQPLNADIFKSPPQKSSESKKLDRILNIWGNGSGVVCLHVFHNIVPSEAYTREAAIIEALSLQHLTNCKRGNYYGPAKTWTMKEKKYLGIALLFKAMHIYLAEGESQLSPSDLI